MEKQIRSTAPFNWMQNLFLLFVALLPFVYSAKGVDPVLLPRQVLVSLLILFFTGFILVKAKKGVVIQSIMPLLFVALGLVYWVSTFQAINGIESQYIALKISVFVSFFLLMYIGFKEQIFTIELVSRGIAISGVVTVGLAIRDMVYLQSHGVAIFEGDNMYKVNATFGHKNLLSSYLFLCLPMLVLQFVYSTKRVWNILIAISFFIIFTVIVLLQTRAVLLAIGICFLVGVLLLVQNRILSEKQRKFGMFLMLGFLGLALTAGFLYKEKLAYITRTESFIERKHVWENTWQMITENPLTGVGAANWQIHFPKYGMQKFYEVNYTITEGLTNFQRPHNDFLWVLAETGAVGFIVYSLIFLVSCRAAYQLYRKEQNGKRQLMYGLILLQLVGFMFISAVDFPLERMEHPLLIFTSIAFIAASIHSSFVKIEVSKWSLLLLLMVAGYSLFICNKRWQSELQLRKMYKAHTSGNWEKLVSEGKKALTPYFNMDYFSIPVSWYIGVGYFMQNKLPLAKQNFEEAYQLHPYQVHVLNNYGACYEKEGNHVRAIELLETANRISPAFSDGIINLSGAYFNSGRYEDAYRTINTIGYDDNNPRLKTFVLAIVKKKIEIVLNQQPQIAHATFLRDLLSNDQSILNYFKEASEQHIALLEYLQNESTQK
jgi:O-antigen ligase